VVNILGVINRLAYLQLYQNATFLLLRSCAYLNSLGKFGFRA